MLSVLLLAIMPILNLAILSFPPHPSPAFLIFTSMDIALEGSKHFTAARFLCVRIAKTKKKTKKRQRVGTGQRASQSVGTEKMEMKETEQNHMEWYILNFRYSSYRHLFPFSQATEYCFSFLSLFLM
jgi:hypothetical protein